MTQAVKAAFVNYAVCAVVGGVLEYLVAPKYRKTLRVAVVGVILAVSLAPFTGISWDVDLENDKAYIRENTTYDALMHTANLTEKKVRLQVKDILIKNGINEYEIYVTTSVDKEECVVYLESIVIEVDRVYESLLPQINNEIPDEYKSIARTGVKND